MLLDVSPDTSSRALYDVQPTLLYLPVDFFRNTFSSYLIGDSDSVVCFMCGVISSNWSINETPWQRHARSAPTCQHVMSQKGHEFIQQTIEQYGEYTERKKEDKIKVSSLVCILY